MKTISKLKKIGMKEAIVIYIKTRLVQVLGHVYFSHGKTRKIVTSRVVPGTYRDCINAKSVYGVEHNQMKPFTFSGCARTVRPTPVLLTRVDNGVTNCELKHSRTESEMSTPEMLLEK